jgi:hypothetical protein
MDILVWVSSFLGIGWLVYATVKTSEIATLKSIIKDLERQVAEYQKDKNE